MAYTLAQQLEFVQTAIRNVEGGIQSITDDDGHIIVYPTLDVLYKREERLLSQIGGTVTPSTNPIQQRVVEF
jgi:hypothetical protein